MMNFVIAEIIATRQDSSIGRIFGDGLEWNKNDIIVFWLAKV